MRQDPALEQEWLRRNNLNYGGLIAIGVFMVQPFLTAGSLDVAARICILGRDGFGRVARIAFHGRGTAPTCMLHRRPQQRDRDALATLGRLHVHTGDGPHRQVIQRRQGPRLVDSPLAQTAAPCPPWTRFLVE